jgi:hypothetical protein
VRASAGTAIAVAAVAASATVVMILWNVLILPSLSYCFAYLTTALAQWFPQSYGSWRTRALDACRWSLTAVVNGRTPWKCLKQRVSRR